MNLKKLSVICLSMLFSVVPICSYAMKEDISKNSKVNSNKVLNEECPICQNEIKCNDVIITPCDHKFCASCLYKSVYLSKDYLTNKFVVKSLCPFCRYELNAKFRYDLKKAVEKINQTATDNEKIDIDDKTIDVHDLQGMQGKTDDEIVELLINKYYGKSVFVHYDNAQDEELLNLLLNGHLDLFNDTYKNYKIPYGALCVGKFNTDAFALLSFNLDIDNMLVDTENGKKLLVIENRDLGEKFEKALKKA